MKIGIQTWGSDGDIRPFIALAQGLGLAGHDVTLVVTHVEDTLRTFWVDSPAFRIERVGHLGMEPDEIAMFGREIMKAGDPLRQLSIIMDKIFEPVADEMYEASQKLAEASDVLLGHFILYPAQVAAEKSGRPYVTVMLNHSGIPSRYLPLPAHPNLGKFINGLLWKFADSVVSRKTCPYVNRLRAREGLKPVKSYLDAWESKRMNLIAVSPVFCRKQPDWGAHHRVCGFLNVPGGTEWEMPEDLRQFLDSGPPPVYLTFGSMMSVLGDDRKELEQTIKILTEAARLAGCRAIIQAPWDMVGGPPRHAYVYGTSFARHESIFPHCSTVVHHGGAGTTHSATLCGRPSVVVAHISDQFFWGAELKRIGVSPGVLKRNGLTAQKLARAIKAALGSKEMQENAARLGNAMRAEGGVGRAVEEINKLRRPAASISKTGVKAERDEIL